MLRGCVVLRRGCSRAAELGWGQVLSIRHELLMPGKESEGWTPFTIGTGFLVEWQDPHNAPPDRPSYHIVTAGHVGDPASFREYIDRYIDNEKDEIKDLRREVRDIGDSVGTDRQRIVVELRADKGEPLFAAAVRPRKYTPEVADDDLCVMHLPPAAEAGLAAAAAAAGADLRPLSLFRGGAKAMRFGSGLRMPGHVCLAGTDCGKWDVNSVAERYEEMLATTLLGTRINTYDPFHVDSTSGLITWQMEQIPAVYFGKYNMTAANGEIGGSFQPTPMPSSSGAPIILSQCGRLAAVFTKQHDHGPSLGTPSETLHTLLVRVEEDIRRDAGANARLAELTAELQEMKKQLVELGPGVEPEKKEKREALKVRLGDLISELRQLKTQVVRP